MLLLDKAPCSCRKEGWPMKAVPWDREYLLPMPHISYTSPDHPWGEDFTSFQPQNGSSTSSLSYKVLSREICEYLGTTVKMTKYATGMNLLGTILAWRGILLLACNGKLLESCLKRNRQQTAWIPKGNEEEVILRSPCRHFTSKGSIFDIFSVLSLLKTWKHFPLWWNVQI